MPNIVYERTPECFVVARGRDPVTEAEWKGYLTALVAAFEEGHHTRELVVTAGGSPTAAQRAEMTARLAPFEATLRIAVLLPSAEVLAALTGAAAGDQPGVRLFGPDDLDPALAFLDVGAAAGVAIKAALAHLVPGGD